MSDFPSRDERLAQIRVEGGEPTPEERAAAIAVIEGMLHEGGSVDEADARDGWVTATRVAPTHGDGHRGSWTTSTR